LGGVPNTSVLFGYLVTTGGRYVKPVIFERHALSSYYIYTLRHIHPIRADGVSSTIPEWGFRTEFPSI